MVRINHFKKQIGQYFKIQSSGVALTWQLAYDKIYKQDTGCTLCRVVCAVCQHWQLLKDQRT